MIRMENFRYRVITNTLAFLYLIAFSLFQNVSHAQNLSDQGINPAVLKIVTAFILEGEGEPDQVDETSVELSFSETDSNIYTIAEEFEISFAQVNQNIEFCFVLNDVDVNLSLVINESPQPLIEGENCFSIPQASQQPVNRAFLSAGGVNAQPTKLSLISVDSSKPSRSLLPLLTRSQWDEVAVRKVLKIFAFGGHARDSQITLWSNMRPKDAIEEMLNFKEHNHLLSPLAENEKYKDTFDQHGTFDSFVRFISDSNSNLPIPVERRRFYGFAAFRFDESFIRMATVRGLNPFRQRIGFWETNYHLATNREASINSQQMAAYYDVIMQAHESNVPYYKVLGEAAKSAAVAMQYGHRLNQWSEEQQDCLCNDDFAREIHQLFYGIYGLNDQSLHENITIPETAKMLTGMQVQFLETPEFRGFATVVSFDRGVERGEHHLEPVNIFNQTVSGASAAEKIDNLMPISMQHPESLQNLPIQIISTLADDNLNNTKVEQLRATWASLGVNRRLLEFIHIYATSTLFHDEQQFKYLTSHERAIYIANKRNLDNVEVFTGGEHFVGRKGFDSDAVIDSDAAGPVFRPLSNVFGGQTSIEASESATAFESNYNGFVNRKNVERSVTLCDDCDEGGSWQKKWADVLPKRADGKYYVSDAAQWLWNHAVGSMDNYTELEKAHLYTMLGAFTNDPSGVDDGKYFFDLSYLLCTYVDYQIQELRTPNSVFDVITSTDWANYPYCREDSGLALSALNLNVTGQLIDSSPVIQSILTELGSSTIPLNEPIDNERDENYRRYALQRVDNALDFIFTTPFIFAEGSNSE